MTDVLSQRDLNRATLARQYLSRWRGRLDRQAQLEASAAPLASVQALRRTLPGG